MDKSWIGERDRFSTKYILGVESFIDFSMQNVVESDTGILCPCNSCRNTKRKSVIEVKRDLVLKGFYVYYREWIYHGEPKDLQTSSADPNISYSVRIEDDELDLMDEEDEDDINIVNELPEMIGEVRDAEFHDPSSESNSDDFERLLSDVTRDLYPGCKNHSLLEFIVKLLNIKVIKPIKHATHFANGIGIIVRHSPELDFTSSWLDVPENSKLPVYAGLDQWFIVKGFPRNPLVKEYVDAMFYNAYKHWKGTLSLYHKKVVEAGEDPKAKPPYDWISPEKWCMQCDYFSHEDFQEKSKKNAVNRSHLPYPHTSGSKSFVARLMEMENKSEVDNFGNTHLRSNGKYVNEEAARKHKEMKQKASQVNEDEENPPEREIMMEVLGTRSGYERGMGYGVQSRRSKRVRCEPTQLEETQEKLSRTQEELQEAVSLIKSQQDQIKLSEEQRQKQDEEIARQKTEIESLKESQNEMKQMLLGFFTQKLS